MITFLENFNQFMVASPSLAVLVWVGVMLLAGAVAGWVAYQRTTKKGAILVGLLVFEGINILSLVSYTGVWLGLPVKPFLPWWLSATFLVAPFIWLGYRIIFYDKETA